MPPNALTDTAAEEVPNEANRFAFPATQWNIVEKAVAGDTPEAAEALSVICERYWLPLYAFARRTGCSPEDAEDATQEFIYTVVRRNSLRTASSKKGRLRSFMMAGLKNHIISNKRRENAQIRGSGKTTSRISIDRAEQLLAEDKAAYSSVAESPAEVFERRWALALLESVLERLRNEFNQKHDAEVFDKLMPFLNGRPTDDGGYVQVAAALGISPNTVRVRVHRLRKHYGEILRREIAGTVPEKEIESEMQFLFSVFQR